MRFIRSETSSTFFFELCFYAFKKKARLIKEAGFVDLKTLGQFANHFILALLVL
jgi:hypothetical protein